MTLRSTQRIACVPVITVVCLLSATAARGQVQPGQNGPQQLPLSEDVFENVALLRGIPVDTFFESMGMFANAMGQDCTFCHDTQAYFDKSLFATQTPMMMRARQMIVMMNTINEQNFGGEARVSCVTCHAGTERPNNVPDLARQYGPPPDESNSMELIPNARFTPEQLFTNYIDAIGGTDRLAETTSFFAEGTYSGFDTAFVETPVEIFSQAPAQLTMIVQTASGDSVRTFDGQSGWMAGPDTPMPLLTLSGGNLERAKLEAMLWFPTPIQQAFPEWRVGLAVLGDIDAQVVQGLINGQPQANFYFGPDGLLVRVVTWTRTPVGAVPTQLDYSDYRDVGGLKIPFDRTVSQTYMQMRLTLTDVQPNAQIDASRFVQPTPGGGPPRAAQ